MGFMHAQIRYLAKICLKHRIRGDVVSIGRQDFFYSLREFDALMVELGLAAGADDGIVFYDREINDRILSLKKSNRHLNETFKNTAVVECPIISDYLFYTALGFENVDAIDISDRDNANIHFDLNEPDITKIVQKRYNLVIDGGTMEHIFDVRRVMRNITDLLETGGCIIHVLPGNNTYDHGFYQFSPTLFHDYYKANRYDLLNIEVLEAKRNMYCAPGLTYTKRWDSCRFWTYDPVLMGKNSFGQLGDGLYFTLCCARKRADSLRDVAPTQYLFSPDHTPILSPWSP